MVLDTLGIHKVHVLWNQYLVDWTPLIHIHTLFNSVGFYLRAPLLPIPLLVQVHTYLSLKCLLTRCTFCFFGFSCGSSVIGYTLFTGTFMSRFHILLLCTTTSASFSFQQSLFLTEKLVLSIHFTFPFSSLILFSPRFIHNTLHSLLTGVPHTCFQSLDHGHHLALFYTILLCLDIRLSVLSILVLPSRCGRFCQDAFRPCMHSSVGKQPYRIIYNSHFFHFSLIICFLYTFHMNACLLYCTIFRSQT